jgi:hypothetical protein
LSQDVSGQYDLIVSVTGGGLSGRAGAVRHGLAKALTHYEPDLRTPLKKEGFLTRELCVLLSAKIWSQKSAQKLPVLEALIEATHISKLKGGFRAAFFISPGHHPPPSQQSDCKGAI